QQHDASTFSRSGANLPALRRQGLSIQQATLRAEAQAPFGEPAYGQRVNLVLGLVHALRQAVWRIVGEDGQYSLYDQWAAVEFLGDEMHAATMFAVASLQGPLMRVQALVLGQQRGVDIQQATAVVR